MVNAQTFLLPLFVLPEAAILADCMKRSRLGSILDELSKDSQVLFALRSFILASVTEDRALLDDHLCSNIPRASGLLAELAMRRRLTKSLAVSEILSQRSAG